MPNLSGAEQGHRRKGLQGLPETGSSESGNHLAIMPRHGIFARSILLYLLVIFLNGSHSTVEKSCLAEKAPLSSARFDARHVAQRGGAATKRVGASGAGPGPNAVRPYLKILAKKTRIYGIAMQSLVFQRLCGFSSIDTITHEMLAGKQGNRIAGPAAAGSLKKIQA